MYQEALLNQLDPNKQGIQAPVDPTTAPIGGSPMDVYNQRLKDNLVSSDPTQRARELADAQGASAVPAQGGQKYALSGYDPGKLADQGHKTEKYQIGRVQEQFDPSMGITPEFLAALNGLDIGDFSGSGDKLSVRNSRNGSRFTDGTGDIIQNYTGDGPKQWTFLDTAEQGAPAAGGGAMGGMAPAMPNLQDLFSGSGQEQIQQGVEDYSQPSQYLAALLAQLGGQQ